MFQAYYSIISASKNGLSHRQRQTVIRRAALPLVVVLLLCATSLRLVASTPALSSVPTAPPTPFTLQGLPSPHSKLPDALQLSAPFPAPQYRPACAPISSLTPQYASLSASESNATIYLALDLQNAQSVLPTFTHELPILLSFMGSHRFHVSILENGSTDLSAGQLVTLARALAVLGTSYEIVVQGEGMASKKEGGRRIVELARLRNAALESLYNRKAAKQLGITQFDMVLFMNDIVWCTSDMLEIIKQHLAQGSHMTCATDWGSNVVYDRWVARTMSGLPFYSQDSLIQYFNGPHAFSPPFPTPLPYNDHERKRFGNLDPFQVFSCWNGAAVIDTRAFFPTSSHTTSADQRPSGTENVKETSQMRFDPSDESDSKSAVDPERTLSSTTSRIRFRTAFNDVSSVTEKASECFLFCVDLWRRGMGKILLVPRASVAYDLAQYERIRQDGRRTVPHPIGIERHVHSRVFSRDSDARWSPLPSSENPDGEDDESGEGAIVKVPWSSTPPARLVYHDYAWWHMKERWGPWDEA